MPTKTTTHTGPITQGDLAEIVAVAELASGAYHVVYETSLCRTGAVLRISKDYRQTALALIQAAGYTARLVSESTIVVTAVIDPITLLDAQIAALTAQRDALAAGT